MISDFAKVFFLTLKYFFDPQIDLCHHFFTTIPYLPHAFRLACLLAFLIATLSGTYVFVVFVVPTIPSLAKTDPGGPVPISILILIFSYVLIDTAKVILQGQFDLVGMLQEQYDVTMYILIWFSLFCYGYGAYRLASRWKKQFVVFVASILLAYLITGVAKIPWINLVLTFSLFMWSFYSIGLTGIQVGSEQSLVKPEIGLTIALFFMTGALYQPLYIYLNYGVDHAMAIPQLGLGLIFVSICIGFCRGTFYDSNE